MVIPLPTFAKLSDYIRNPSEMAYPGGESLSPPPRAERPIAGARVVEAFVNAAVT
jgi:hypothetical protein